MSVVFTLRRHQQEEEYSEYLFYLNHIHQTISSMKVTLSDPEVKVTKVLASDKELDPGKYDFPSAGTFYTSDQHSDITSQDLSDRWGIHLSISSKTLKKTTKKCMCISILLVATRYRTE